MRDDVDFFQNAALILAHDDSHMLDAVVPPIFQSSLFTFKTFEEMASTYRGKQKRHVYSRVTNPTVRLFEEKIAVLEEADDAIGFASGMAAIYCAIFSFVKPGDRILCVRHVYPDTYRLMETILKKWGINCEYVDGCDVNAVEAALPGAKLLYLESPTSWTMETQAIGIVAAAARRHGALTVVDNSCATSIFQKPIKLGADLVLHAASKYIGGHSDTVAGVVAGRAELIDRIRQTIVPYLGAKLSPFDAWLLLRGLRTLPLRMQAHEASALSLAQRLDAHRAVVRVFHPGLRGDLPSGMLGTSGLFAFEFADCIDIPAFCDGLRVFKLGASWGGHESLAMPALVQLMQAAQPSSAADFGLPPRVVRLSVGLEGIDALWGDITQAIDAATLP